MSARQKLLDIADEIAALSIADVFQNMAKQLRAVVDSLAVPSDDVMAHHLAVLRDKGDAVYQIERDAIARYIEAQSAEISSLRRDAEHDRKNNALIETLYREKTERLEAAESKLSALTERCEALEKALEQCGDLFSEIKGDFTDPRNECIEGKRIADTAIAEKSNG